MGWVEFSGALAAPVEAPQAKEKTALDSGWAVLVWDDPINTQRYVVFVFQRVLHMNKEEATRHMLEVHNEGKSMVKRENKERAEFYVHQLQAFGLQSTMESL